MRILAHIHTLNDEAVIERSLGAVLGQTRPVDGVVIVDNGSTDGTLERSFPAIVTVIRHGENLGTNGAIHAGMTYAVQEGYDWVWLFDADSAPRPDALERLLAFHDGLPEEVKRVVWNVASVPYDVTNRRECGGMLFTPKGFVPVLPSPTREPFECVATIWSGSLYKTEAIREVGLPSPDYVLDWGENAYGYQGYVSGHKAFMVPDSMIDHNIDTTRGSGGVPERVSFGPFALTVIRLSPMRYYYVTRNFFFFWLYVYEGRGVGFMLRMLPAWARRTLKMILVFLRLGRWGELAATLRGIGDGFLGRMDRRY